MSTNDSYDAARLSGALLISAQKSHQIAEAAKQRGIQVEMDSMHRNEVARLKLEKEIAESDLRKKDKRIKELEAAAKLREEVVVEWMHSNEAFKLLARQYGKRLGVSDLQRQEDFDQNVLDAAEDNPDKFGKTRFLEKTREALKATR